MPPKDKLLCLRCPDESAALSCGKGKFCQPSAEFSIDKYWRSFPSGASSDTSVLSSAQDCSELLEEAAKVTKASIKAVRTNAATKKLKQYTEEFDRKVPDENTKATFKGVIISKELLEHAHTTVHANGPSGNGNVQSASASNENNKSSAQNDEPESSTAKALASLNIQDSAPLPSVPGHAGNPQEAVGPNNTSQVPNAPSNMMGLPLVLCNRCPTFGEAFKNHSHAGALSECFGRYSTRDIKPSELWWGYQNEGDQHGEQPEDLFPTVESAREFLVTVEEDNRVFISEAGDMSAGSLSNQENRVTFRRFQHEYAGQIITKQMLEYAAIVCNGFLDHDLLHATQRAGGEKPEQELRQLEKGEASWGSSSLFEQGAVSSRTPLVIKENDDKISSWAKRSDIVKSSGQKSVGIVTNHFKITVKPGIKLFEYQVIGLNEEGQKLSANRKKVILQRLINNSKVLKDGVGTFAWSKEGRIIAWKPLTANNAKDEALELFSINDFSRERQSGLIERVLKLDLVFKREINLDDFVAYAAGNNAEYQETGTAAALDILVSHGVKHLSSRVAQIGNNKFFPTDSAAEENDFGLWEMIALRGFSSNIKAGNGSLLLNVNTAFSVFYRSQTVADYLQYFKSINASVPRDKDATNHLIGLRVRILYDRKKDDVDPDIDSEHRRTKTITGFSKNSAAVEEFRDHNDKPVTVWAYFKSQHKAAADKSDSSQICVNTGGTQKGTNPCWYLPDQLLVLPGQIYSRTLEKLDSKEPNASAKSMTEKMIAFACRKPSENRDAIEKSGLKALGLEKGAAGPQVLLDAGISIERSMMGVQSRQILTPVILYGKESTAKFDTEKPASWSSRGQTLLSISKQISKGVHFIHLDNIRDAEKIQCEDNFKSILPKNGLKTDGYQLNWSITGSTREEIEACLKSSNADLTVFVLRADRTRPAYAAFRSVLDQTLGQPSIVFNAARLFKCNPGAYMGGNALKINLRLGNENHTLKTGFESLKYQGRTVNTLVLGADMIHPKQSSAKCTPSIGALVGSVDGNFAKFLGSARHQKAGQEYIEKELMVSMAKERIQAWKKKQGKFPEKILFYRDGTGDSQYDDVMKFEVEGIKQAWKACTGRLMKTLQMTTIVAIKRHATRFYPTTPEHETKTGNCIPGLVVDRDITSPYTVDFYLQSHDVEMKKDDGQGSAKPTHYFVLENGMKLTETSLQNITNNFCYMFAHSTSAVSYAAPAYYADKLCERASLYLRRFYDNDWDVEELSETTQKSQMKSDWGRGGRGANGNPWHEQLDDKMFWM